MTSNVSRWPSFRPGIRIAAALAVGAAILFSTTGVAHGDTPKVVRVEEDWELVLATPDPNVTAPQVTCSIFPWTGTDSLFATFELNHQSQPDFVSGGMQLVLWHGEQMLLTRKFPQANVMASSGETVRWTQTMTLDDGVLTFEIVNGSSTTWGSFGGQGYLRMSVATNLDNLNAYNPALTVENSGVGYAGNRVTSLVLKRVRLITEDEQILEDHTQRVVHTND